MHVAYCDIDTLVCGINKTTESYSVYSASNTCHCGSVL